MTSWEESFNARKRGSGDAPGGGVSEQLTGSLR
jgi:hypothetical protein